jgi:DNA-binding MarR family transcriptional regulator
VLMALHAGSRSHGALCRELEVSTGAMTNRLDKLEREQLVHRSPDPDDRRGVLLELTADGRACRRQWATGDQVATVSAPSSREIATSTE